MSVKEYPPIPEIQDILNLKLEDLKPYAPTGDIRIDFLEPLKEALVKSYMLNVPKVSGLAGLTAPTGAGKTDFLLALAVKLALNGNKITILTAGKAHRVEVMLRLTEIVARMIKRGEKPPKILVVFSKLETCISNDSKIREIIDTISTVPEEDREKLVNLFYSRCRYLISKKRPKCQFYENVREHGKEIAETVLDKGYVFVLGRFDKEILDQMKTTAPVAYSMRTRAELPPFVVDLIQVGQIFGVCPYYLIGYLAGKVDIIVLDNTYVLYRKVYSRANEGEGNSRVLDFVNIAFSSDRTLIIDEVHEVPFMKTAKISYKHDADTPNHLYKLKPSLAKEVSDIVSDALKEDGWLRIRDEFAGYKYDASMPRGKLPTKYIQRLRSIVRRGRKLLGETRLSGRTRLLVEAELSLIETLIELENAFYKVSFREDIEPGITIFMRKYGSEGMEVDYIIPTLLTPTLRKGRDYRRAILASATISPIHLILTHKIRRELAENIIASVEWETIQKTRNTFYVNSRAYMEERPVIAETIKRVIKEVGDNYDVVLIVASSTWRDLLREAVESIGYRYYPLLEKPATSAEASRIISEVRELIGSRTVIHISPHGGFAKGVDFIPRNVESTALVLVPSEAIQPTDEYTLAQRLILENKYRLGRWYAWFVVNVTRAMYKVIQAVGRVQRSGKHRADIVLIGRYFNFRDRLKKYAETYGRVIQVENGAEIEPDPEKLASAIIASLRGEGYAEK